MQVDRFPAGPALSPDEGLRCGGGANAAPPRRAFSAARFPSPLTVSSRVRPPESFPKKTGERTFQTKKDVQCYIFFMCMFVRIG